MNHQKSGPAKTVPAGLAPTPMIGASLSKPHTSRTALQDACVYLIVIIYRKFKLNEWIQRISNLHTC